MKRIRSLVVMATALWLVCCEDPNKDKDFAIFDEVSVAEYFDTREEFSLWAELLRKTNLYNSLTVSNTFTCFAAKNEAVQAYLEANGWHSVAEMDLEKATYLMRYHVIVGMELATSAMSNGRLADTTASGDYLVTKVLDGGVIQVNDEARIITKDLSVRNGTVHVLEQVLDPVMDPLWVVIRSNPEYSIFADGIEQTGWNEKLSEIRLATGAKNYLTVFVVPDAVYRAKGINNFDDLVARYAFGNPNYTDLGNQLNRYIAYHFVSGAWSFNELAEFPTANKLKNMATMAQNELIMVEDVRGELILNRSETDEEDHPTGGYRLPGWMNLQAKNGLMHEIDGLMPVYSPEPSTVKIELTDANYFPEFATLSWYRRGSEAGQGKSDYINMENENQFPYIRWQTVPAGGGSIRYETRGTWGNNFFDNADVLVADVGAVGWWEMDLPSVVKGRYKVTFKYHFAVGRGTYQASIDGRNVGSPVVFGNTGVTYTYRTADLGVVSLLETGPHTIRFTSVSPGIMEIDYIVFEPLK